MRKPDIRARVLLAALLPATVIALLLVSFFVTVRFNDLEDALRLRGRTVARHLATAAEYGLFSGNRDALQTLAEAARSQSELEAVLITGRNGDILARSGRPLVSEQTSQTVDATEYASGDGMVLTFNVPVSSAPVPLDDLLAGSSSAPPSINKGRVIIEVGRRELLQHKHELFATSLGIALLVLAGGGLLAARMSRGVTRPVDEIAEAVESISQGNFNVRVTTDVGGSLETLAERINEMGRQLATSHEDMQRRIGEATEELRLRKDEAERANVAKSRFLAAASHDLRQPMHALGLFVAQLQSQVHTPEARHLVKQVSESVRALDGLLDGLLDISKLDAGVLAPTLSNFPIAPALQRLETDYTGPAEQKGLYLRARPSGLWVRTDPALLERILLNLVSNALRYTDRGGILIACRIRGDRLRIEVRDSGLGIAPESQATIFQEFVQLHNPGRNRGMGLGLGLAIVKRLVTLLGLTLDLRSAPGQGSVFAVEVPLAEAMAGSQEPAPSSSLPTNMLEGKTVVVVDDDSLVLSSVVGLLESWGCVVLPAASGAQAVDRISRTGIKPDAILCDYRLKEPRSGVEVIRDIRELFGRGLAAALISGDTDPEVLRLARESGLALLHKPVSPAKLRTLLQRMLLNR